MATCYRSVPFKDASAARALVIAWSIVFAHSSESCFVRKEKQISFSEFPTTSITTVAFGSTDGVRLTLINSAVSMIVNRFFFGGFVITIRSENKNM